MTSPEMNLLGGNDIRKTGYNYWLLSPSSFSGFLARVRFVSSTGGISFDVVSPSYGVRPSVVLKPETEYSSGDGSMSNPYIVDTSGV
jgi:hypothetical protein